MKATEIRQKFVEFFKNKSHTFVPPASTIAIGDKSILFTIAGMAQFKAALTGQEQRSYKRATNFQKCIRVADLDDIGKDGRHLSMFEMMGSWSFGDYYKKEAIAWAYEFVVQVLKFDLNKLWVTVHHSDDEAYEIWLQMGISPERIRRLGDKDNFWAMGPTGPCGPCSELYFDQGPSAGKCHDKKFDCKAGPGCDCDRYLEFWNLVFMQFDRQEDGTLKDLPMKSVDTGAGLERMAALSQGKTSAFEIDAFSGIIAAIKKRAGLAEDASWFHLDSEQRECIQIIADHIRTLSFTIADGVNFASDGRGYVIRRILRRATRYARKLAPMFSQTDSFLAGIVPAVVDEFAHCYPELAEHQGRIVNGIRVEELRFLTTLNSGLEKFQQFIKHAKSQNRTQLEADEIFLLHDTFGFPSDLTRVLCEEINFKIDLDGFQKCMDRQKEQSRSEAKFYKSQEDLSPWVVFADDEQPKSSDFTGYDILKITDAVAKSYNGKNCLFFPLKNKLLKVRQLKNKLFELILSSTPFYPEGGGQAADGGWILATTHLGEEEWEVVDVQRTPNAIVHVLSHGVYSSPDSDCLSSEEIRDIFVKRVEFLQGVLDLDRRAASARNHTATHLLHKALRVVLGDSVRQAGSLVTAQLLRFDFTCDHGLSADEIYKLELLVNSEILKDTHLNHHQNIPLQKAKDMGAVAIFDEKYGDNVRVVEVPGFSLELCGGTHVTATGNIGAFKILSEGSVNAGVRRIEAVTGLGALQYIQELKGELKTVAQHLGSSEHDVLARIQTLQSQLKLTENKLEKLQNLYVSLKVDSLLNSKITIQNSISLIAAVVKIDDPKELEIYADLLKDRGIEAVVLASVWEEKIVVIASLKAKLVQQYKNLNAGKIVKTVCEQLGGRGGGKPEFAKGGGTDVDKLSSTITEIPGLIERAIVG